MIRHRAISGRTLFERRAPLSFSDSSSERLADLTSFERRAPLSLSISPSSTWRADLTSFERRAPFSLSGSPSSGWWADSGSAGAVTRQWSRGSETATEEGRDGDTLQRRGRQGDSVELLRDFVRTCRGWYGFGLIGRRWRGFREIGRGWRGFESRTAAGLGGARRIEHRGCRRQGKTRQSSVKLGRGGAETWRSSTNRAPRLSTTRA
uniref:Uncharacterized protein n=1 Tax=Ananas comosus var. bracteatus TaxID=296719 RepID=A0A6V7P1L5_ANACO|nr:unnamed protein product [Ananas comosus var. bracteatus]